MFQKDAALHLENKFGLSRSEQIKGTLADCDPMVRFNIEQLESALLSGLSSGILSPNAVRGSVVDFGCDRGSSTALLLGYGSNVTGVEINTESVQAGKSLSSFPEGKVIRTDGIAYLKSLPEASLDLVTASMLGPDIQGNLCREFLNACKHALKPEGVVLVSTDLVTMETVQRVNPLNNGFLNQGVFIAIRGMDAPRFDLLKPATQPKEEIDFRALFKGLNWEEALNMLKK
jgi:SAM-dependent methyltransferase